MAKISSRRNEAACRQLKGSYFTLLIGLALLITGCASTPSKDYSTLYQGGDYKGAAQAVIHDSRLNREKLEEKQLLAYLYTGSAFFADQSWNESIEYFDLAEEIMKNQDMAIIKRSLGTVGAGIVNDNVMSYRRREYDGIMVNTYKAVCFLAMDKPHLARVELLRSDDRQRRAVERFSKLIEQSKETLQEEQASNKDSEVEKVLQNSQNQNQLEGMLSSLDAWGAYTDFVNPFATYLHGLFFLTLNEGQSDLERSMSSLERVYGMTGSRVVLEDLSLAEKIASGRATTDLLKDYVWVIYENGIGPRKKEKRMEIVVPYKRVTYTGIAVPELVKGRAAYPRLDIREGAQLLASTEVVCDMDSVVATEFKQELPMIYMRSVTSAVIKTFIQYSASREMEKKNGKMAGFLTAVALGAIQAGTTQADVRIWESLPKDFQIARCRRPGSGRLQISVPGAAQPLAEVSLPGSESTIIWIKSPAAGGIPSITVMNPSGNGSISYPQRDYTASN